MHGKTSMVRHGNRGVFKDLASPFQAARYHSLAVKPPKEKNCLTVTAHSDDGVVMGLSHSEFPVHGVQFHPESFLTRQGFRLIENFLKMGPIRDFAANG